MVTLPLTPRATWPRSHYLAAAAIALIAVLLRVPYFWWPITPDEAGYALGAYWWSQGVTLYSPDLWFDRPQGIFWAYQLGIAVFGDSVGAIRLLGALWFAAGAAGAWALTRALVNERAALFAGGLTALASASPYVEGFTSNAEAFMVTATTLSALATWRGRYGWAGVLAGVAVLLKPSGGAAIALGLMWLVLSRRGPREWVLFGAACAAPLLGAFAHGWATVGIGAYLDAAILFRVTHPVDFPLARMATGLLGTLPVTLPLTLCAVPGLRYLEGRSRTFTLLWLATSVAGVAMGGNWWPHYFAQLVPPLALGYGTFLAALGGVGRLRELAVWSVGVALIAVPVLKFASLGPTEGSLALYQRDGLQVEEAIGRHIRERTDASDRIYVAFSEPGVNFFAQRLSTVPWLYPQQIIEVDGAYDSILESAQRAAPVYIAIIDDRPAHASAVAALREAMGDRYELEREYPGAAVYRRR